MMGNALVLLLSSPARGWVSSLGSVITQGWLPINQHGHVQPLLAQHCEFVGAQLAEDKRYIQVIEKWHLSAIASRMIECQKMRLIKAASASHDPSKGPPVGDRARCMTRLTLVQC